MNKIYRYFYGISTIFIILFLVENEAIGIIYVKFNRFLNPKGLGKNGHCCDGKYGLCQTNGCDNMFTICFVPSDAGGTDDESFDDCDLGKYQSRSIGNQNSNTFKDRISDLNNPLHFTVGKILDSFKIKVKIMDKDGVTKSDVIDFLYKTIDFNQLEITSPNKNVFVRIDGRTRLQIAVWYKCASKWYGPKCDILCQPPSHDEYYTCDIDTGVKICKAGWVGPNCAKRDSCHNWECQNGGKCLLNNLKPMCSCLSDFEGTFCEIRKCDEYCKPGRCYLFPNQNQNQFYCFCPSPDGVHEYFEEGSTDEGLPLKCNNVSKLTTQVMTTVIGDKNEEETSDFKKVYPTPQSYRANMDCDSWASNPSYRFMSGVYEIKPYGDNLVPVYCEMTTIGWTIIQRRLNDELNFNRDWESYKVGFGQPESDYSYWIGLEHLYYLTTQSWYRLHINLQVPDGTYRTAEYQFFYIENEENGYRLHVHDYSGTAGDGLNERSFGNGRIHNKMKFSTYDMDHDLAPNQNCAQQHQCGWWFNSCFWVNLNGVYKKYRDDKRPKCGPRGLCIPWQSISGFSQYSLMSVTMKIIPTNTPTPEIIKEMTDISFNQ